MGISRRNFLKGTAAGALSLSALGIFAGCAAEAKKDENITKTPENTDPVNEVVVSNSGNPDWLGDAPGIKDADIKETWETNLLIVGAGNGGMIAAAKASDYGLDFRVVEQNTVVGDTRGWYGAINSSDCKENGLEVDVPLLRSEYSRYASGKIDQRVLNVWINESAAMHDYVKPIMESYGFTCDFTTDTGIDEENQTQYYRPAQEHFYNANPDSQYKDKKRNQLLEDYINKKGYTIDFGYSLVELVKDGEKVVGAIVQNVDTEEYVKIKADAVMLATGGYPGNPEMIEALNPILPKCITACSYSPSDKGQGIKAALWAGAVKDLEPAPMIFDRGLVEPGVDAGYVTDESGNKVFPGTVRQFNPGTQPFLKVNRDGERFANESCPYNDISHAASLQKGGVYCQVFDSNIMEDVQRFHTLGCSAGTRKNPKLMDEDGLIDTQVKAGLVKKADTIDELADMLGFTGEAKETFLATVERYNTYYDNQNDEEFGKPAYRLSAIRKAPFYGLWLGGSLLTTCDGVRINTDMQALKADGSPVEGLYVTGDCSGSMFADNYPELFPGTALGRTLTFALHIVDKLVEDGMKTGVGSTKKEDTSTSVGPTTADGLKDGTYSSSAKGIEGEIPVTVTIKNGKITAIDADYSKETPTIGGVNGEAIVKSIMDANGTEGVDTISGATITTEAIIKAVNKCLSQAQ